MDALYKQRKRAQLAAYQANNDFLKAQMEVAKGSDLHATAMEKLAHSQAQMSDVYSELVVISTDHAKACQSKSDAECNLRTETLKLAELSA